MAANLRAWRWKARASQAAKDCFCNPDGSLNESAKILFRELRSYCYIDCSSHAVGRDGHTDVPATMVAEGRRQACFRLIELIEMDLHAVRDATNEVSNE